MDTIVAIELSALIWRWTQQQAVWVTTQLTTFVMFYFIFLAVDTLTATVGMLFAERRSWKLLPLTIVQRFFYRQLMYFIVIKSIVFAIKGQVVGWQKLERHGLEKSI
jgi:hypothetical protein